jgi:predicted permease
MTVSLTALLVNVLLPILVMVGLGALMNRRGRIQIDTLNQLTIYLLVPSFLFEQVAYSSLTWSAIAEVTWGSLIPVVLLGAILVAVYRWRGYKGSTTSALLLGGLVYNAGNFGLPVTELFYRAHPDLFGRPPGDGVAVQAMVIMLSNIAVWMVGYGVIAWGKGQGMRGLLGFFKLPMLYTVIAAFFVRESGTALPQFILVPVQMLAVATVPVMLLTLGTQLARNACWPQWRLIGPAMATKLLLLPATTAAVCWAFGIWPWPGAQLTIAAAAPTAVNTLIISLELDGDSRTAADCVFWTTIGSIFTVTCVLILVAEAGR